MAPNAALNSLLALGIPPSKALFALSEHGNEVEAAADWCWGEGADWTPQSLLSTHHKPTTAERAPSTSPPPSFARLATAPAPSSHPSASQYSINRPPPRRLLLRGTGVLIILKEDQPTGRTVSGLVGEVLTKGDHPRGVKKKKCTTTHSPDGSCDRCRRTGLECGNGPRASASPRTSSTQTSSPATSPDSTTSSRQISPSSTTASLLTTQLSLSLSYHCISLCFQHSLVPGLSGLATVDTSSLTNAFRVRSLDASGEPDDLLKNDLFALLCFYQGAKVSNHSAIIGPVNVPAFDDYPFALPSSEAGGLLTSLGSRRLDVILALHDQVSTVFDELIARSRVSLQARIERVILACLVIWSTFNVRRMAWMHERSGRALQAGVRLLKEMKVEGVPTGLVMSSLSDLAGCHYMVAGMFAMPPMLTTEQYLAISDPNVPTITEMTSQDELAVVFTLDRQNIDGPPVMTHLHLTLQECIVSTAPLSHLLPKTWRTVDILLAFITRLLSTLSPDAEDYSAMVQHITTRELSYLGLEIICFRRLWYESGAGMSQETFDELMRVQRERVLAVTPRLVEGIRLLLSLKQAPARSLDSIWLVNNIINNLIDCGFSLEDQLAGCNPEQTFALRQGIRLLAFTDEAAIGTLISLERMADQDRQTHGEAVRMVDSALQQLELGVMA